MKMKTKLKSNGHSLAQRSAFKQMLFSIKQCNFDA